MNKLEALKAARVYVRELYDITYARGYPRFTGSVNDVLDQELRIAKFLVDDEDETPRVVTCGY